MSYHRVIPRDLFNEAKLLKCLGQMSLLIHNGVRWPLEFDFEHENKGFVIEFDELNNTLYCSNLLLMLNGNIIPLYSNYNSREDYPLYTEDGITVFDDVGRFTTEFSDYLDEINSSKSTHTD